MTDEHVADGRRPSTRADPVGQESLRALLDRVGTLPPADVAVIGSGIAARLSAIHPAGVAHGQVRPENVLLDRGGTPTAGSLGPRGLRLLDPTTTSVPAAGHAYSSPELGLGVDTGPASDLYALGAVLYELCSGHAPAAGSTPWANEQHDGVRPDGVPDELWELISWLMVTDPGDRPSSAGQVATALEAMAPRLSGVPAAPVQQGPVPTKPPAPVTVAEAAQPAAAEAGRRPPTPRLAQPDDRHATPPGTRAGRGPADPAGRWWWRLRDIATPRARPSGSGRRVHVCTACQWSRSDNSWL